MFRDDAVALLVDVDHGGRAGLTRRLNTTADSSQVANFIEDFIATVLLATVALDNLSGDEGL